METSSDKALNVFTALTFTLIMLFIIVFVAGKAWKYAMAKNSGESNYKSGGDCLCTPSRANGMCTNCWGSECCGK